MKRILTILIVTVAWLGLSAQTPTAVLESAIRAVDRAGGITASYQVSQDGKSMSGRVAMRGSKFVMLSTEVKSWYDGKTQWTYSSATGEVNITTPTAADLQMTNPLATLRGLKQGFIATKSKTQPAGGYAMTLVPKQRSQVKEVILTVNSQSSLPVKADVTMRDGTRATLTISSVKTRQSLPDATFKFERGLVPEGTPVVDLR